MEKLFDVDGLLEKLEDQYDAHRNSTKKIEELLDEQEGIISEGLKESEPVYQWYKRKGFFFAHPTYKLRSASGPILGFDEKKEEVIVYDIEREGLQKVYIHDNSERKNYSTYNLVKEGYFEDAIVGIKYLEKMLEHYLEVTADEINKLKSEISKWKIMADFWQNKSRALPNK